MLARRFPFAFLTPFLVLALFGQTNTAAGAGTYPAQPEPNSFANLGVRPEVLPWDQGEAGLHLLAKKLKNTGRIMHLTAHPDDEDGALLTFLARGQGRQVLLMSLTRGEGGQNRTGSNLWDELGVLRTLELLESTRYYGTELRFSRVADFGFSKSADETFKKWGGHEVPLRDIVYVIREWKPDVLFTRFSGTPRDGHGMHQASAILAPEAVKCAADPNCFPDQLKGDHALTTWQVLKLYMGNQGGEYTVRYDVSQIDPDTKLSYAQMALEGFKHQASQLSGDFKMPTGPAWRSYKLTSTTIPNYKADKEQDFFDGIDTTIAGAAPRIDAKANWLPVELSKLQRQLGDVQVGRGDRLVAALRTIYGIEGRLRPKDLKPDVIWQEPRMDSLSDELHRRAEDIFKTPTQVIADLNRPAVRGEGVSMADRVTNNSGGLIQTQGYGFSWVNPFKQEIAGGRGNGLYLDEGRQASLQKKAFVDNVQVPKTQPYTRPHWHRDDPERDAIYKVDDSEHATWPVVSAPALGVVFFSISGQSFDRAKVATQSGHGRFVPLVVVPEISLLFERVTQVVTPSGKGFQANVRVRSTSGKTKRVTVELQSAERWNVDSASKTVDLDGTNEKTVPFTVSFPPGRSGTGILRAVAIAGDERYTEGYSTITRPDLDTFYYYQPAIQRVSIVDVNIPKNLRVGYIPGAGDDIFPVLQQLGLNAKLISNDELAKGDLHQYDTIVVGIRGYDERPEIRDNNQRLLAFVNDGGTLLVQNQKAEDLFNSGKFTPYPATLGRQRVSVEEAPVEVLAPNDSIFNAPNKITQADFEGWVQERGINFMSDWDAKFEPLLASNDPGEQPLKGGLLRAKYGKGTYIYTGYAFFRQLPAGVPGAVRLYVNLLNAGHETK